MTRYLDRDLTDRKKVAEVDMAPLLSEGYTSQLQADLGKKLRKPPATEFQQVNGLFDQALPGWAS